VLLFFVVFSCVSPFATSFEDLYIRFYHIFVKMAIFLPKFIFFLFRCFAEDQKQSGKT